MKIALLGYGKMGREIEEAALQNGHEIVLKINSQNFSSLSADALKIADVAIEFSKPDVVLKNIELCFGAGIPIVAGTTGWYDKLNEVKKLCEASNGSFLYASNFSIGVNLFFALNKFLAALMKNHPSYSAQITETHHIHKLDKPSGTAITLANEILSASTSLKKWALTDEPGALKINSIRQGEVTGLHTVGYTSSIDKIEITHEAFNRKGFAQGAVIAAQWLKNKKGFFEMKDVVSELLNAS